MRDHFLAKILKFGVYAAAFIPLVIFSQFISPFHFGKVIVFRSIIEILFVFYLILIWKNKSYLPSRNLIFWAFLLFTLVFGITTLTSSQPYESFWGTLERMGGFWSFLHFFVYYIILTSVIRTRKEWLRLLDIAIFVGILSAIYGFGQKTDIKFFIGSGNRARIFGTLGNAALFGGYELMITFLSLTLFLRTDISRNKRLYYFAGLAVAGASTLMTAVRGSILGLALGLVVFAFLSAWKYRSAQAKKMLIVLVAAMAILVAGVLLFRGSDFIKKSGYLTRITDFSFKSYTVQTRFWAWEAGLKGWRETPNNIILGWGPENFNIPFSRNFNPNFFTGMGAETFFDRAHSMFVESLVTMGIIGLAAYVLIFFASLKTLWHKLRQTANADAPYFIGMISLLVAYIVHNAFFFDTSANFLLFFTVLGFISFLSYGSPEISSSGKGISKKQELSFAVLLILTAVLIYKTNIIPAKANYATTRAIVSGWQGDYRGGVDKFKESLSYNTFGSYEYRHRYAEFVFENYSKLTAQDILDVIKEVEKNASRSQLDYLPHLYLARLYILLGKDDPNSEYNDLALAQANKALELSPKFVRAYYETGQAYANKKEYDKAIEEFKKAIALNPDVGASYWYLGNIEGQKGNTDTAISLMEKSLSVPNRYSITEPELLKLASFYIKKNNYPKLAETYERLVRFKTRKAEYSATLAAIYARLGRIEDAIAQAKEAAKLNPAFESEARSFVNSIGGTW